MEDREQLSWIYKYIGFHTNSCTIEELVKKYNDLQQENQQYKNKLNKINTIIKKSKLHKLSGLLKKKEIEEILSIIEESEKR